MATINIGRVRPTYKAAWAADVAYIPLDYVMHTDSSIYIALKDVPAGLAPVENPEYWAPFGVRGEIGNGIDSFALVEHQIAGDLWKMTFTDGDAVDILVPKGERGEQGNGIVSITFDKAMPDGSYRYVIVMDDGETAEFIAPKGPAVGLVDRPKMVVLGIPGVPGIPTVDKWAFIINISPFATLFNYTFGERVIDIARDENFTDLMVTTTITPEDSDVAMTSYTVPEILLGYGVTYYARVRDKNNNGDYSDYSIVVKATTSLEVREIAKPSIISPAAGAELSSDIPVFQFSPPEWDASTGTVDLMRVGIDSPNNTVFDSGWVPLQTAYTVEGFVYDWDVSYSAEVQYQESATMLLSPISDKRSYTTRSTFIATPTVTSPREGATVTPGRIDCSISAFTVNGGADIPIAIEWFIYGDAEQTQLLYTDRKLPAVPGIFWNQLFTGNTVGQGMPIWISALYEGEVLGKSAMSPAVRVQTAVAARPYIESPVAGATCFEAVTIVVSEYEFENDPYVSWRFTDYRLTSDAAGEVVIAEALNTDKATAYTFSDFNFVEGATLYAWARWTLEFAGVSAWSAPRAFVMKAAIVTPGGRKIYRHPSGMGTIMEFYDGLPRKVLVLDAVYRDKSKWGTYNHDMEELTNYKNANIRGDNYINTISKANTNAATKMTDAQINSLFSAVIDTNTAKQNCDAWMTRQSYTDGRETVGVPAVTYARSKSVDGNPCDIPNIQTLMRMFLDADELDNLDPTIPTARSKALGIANSSNFWTGDGANETHSSTENSFTSTLTVARFGQCSGAIEDTINFITPIQELPVTALTTPGGRKLYRHDSGMGTVMEFSDGQARKVLILDAVYRVQRKWGSGGYDMPSLPNYSNTNTRNDWFLNTTAARNLQAATKMTDAQINSLWATSIDVNTAKHNCDEWLTRDSLTDASAPPIKGVPAISYTRSILVGAKPCDVPNFQTLMRIFLDADEIDLLDPTVPANRLKALGIQNSSGFWASLSNPISSTFAISSTEASERDMRAVVNSSECLTQRKTAETFVIPILELTPDYTITPGGRKLYRHKSGMGTVMEFNDGQDRKVIVVDAAYRINRADIGGSVLESPLTNYDGLNTRGDVVLNTSNTPNTKAATKMTDAQINSLWAGVIDKNTAKQNCDVLASKPFVIDSRAVLVGGVPCDVPNIQTLMRIFLDADEIDLLDPTVAEHSSKALGSKNPNGFWRGNASEGHAGASTEAGLEKQRCISEFGHCGNITKNALIFLAPVLEI